MSKFSQIKAPSRTKRYFLLTASMQVSEEMSKVVIAKNAAKAEEFVEDELTFQDFSSWNSVGQEIESAMELGRVEEITQLEYEDYKKQFPD